MGFLRGLAYYFLFYFGASLLLGTIWNLSARFTNDGHPDIRIDFPMSIHEVRKLNAVIQDTYDVKGGPHLYAVLLFSSGYLFKQTFSLFGTVYLNFLAYFLFGLFYGSILCSFLQAIGSCGFYIISRGLFRPLFKKKLPRWLKRCHRKCRRLVKSGRRKFLLGRIIAALRIFPFIPNWFVNIVSAQLGVPLWLHFFATFFGSLPYTFFNMVLGLRIEKVNSFMQLLTGDFIILQIAGLLMFITVLVLDPLTMALECSKVTEEALDQMDQ